MYLVNSKDLVVWKASPSELRVHLRGHNVRLFYHLNRALKQYPPEARTIKGDEPQFRLPCKERLSKSLMLDLVGCFGARIVDRIYPR